MRRVLLGLAMLVALLCAAVLFVFTPPGERMLKAFLLPRINEAIPGRLELESIDLSGTGVAISNVTLRDPEGVVVAHVARVEAQIELRPLLHNEISLERVRITGPVLQLSLDGRGLNLLRAVAKDTPKDDQDEGTSNLVVRVRSLELEGGEVSLDQTEIEALSRQVHVSELSAKGELLLTQPGLRIESKLDLKGRITRPTEGPLSLHASIDTARDHALGEVQLEIAGIRFEASGAQRDADHASAKLLKLEIPHAATHALLPVWPLVADVSGSGELELKGGKADLSLAVGAADGRVRLGATVDLNLLHADRLEVEADGLDFSRLVENGPASKLALRLKASGSGTSLSTLDGKVDLQVPEATLDGQTFGPIELRGRAKDGTFDIARLEVKLPGASLTATGNGTPEKVRLEGVLQAQNLARVGDTLGRIVSPKGLPLSGNGRLSFVVHGHPEHPGVRLKGGFPALSWADISVRALELDGSLPDIRRPLDADAHLKAGTLQLGERNFEQVQTKLVTRGRTLSAEITAQGLANLSLHLGGTVDKDRKGIALSELRLQYPEATWALQHPTHVTFGDGDVHADELALAAADQRIVISGGLRGTRIDAGALIQGLRLDRLPKSFVPETMKLGGVLDAKVEAQGTTSHPIADAKVTLRGGRIETLEDLELDLDAHYAQDRAHGELTSRGVGSRVKGTFDLPIAGLRKGTREPLSVSFTVEPTELEKVCAALKLDLSLSGQAAATLKIDGTAAEPRVRVVVDGDQLQYKQAPRADLDLLVESDPEGRIVARIDLDSMGGQSFLLIRTPFTAAQFITGPVNGRMFLETPVAMEGSFQEFPVEGLSAWGLVKEGLRGKASFTLEANGPARAPKGKIHLAVRQLSATGLEPMELFGTVSSLDDRVELSVTAMRQQTLLAEVSARLKAPVDQLIGRDPSGSSAIEVDGDLGPLTLTELQSFAGMELAEQVKNRPSGMVQAKLQIRGTLDAPRATLALRAEKLGIGKLALGSVALDYAYQETLSKATVVLTSSKGGALKLEGNTRFDLSFPALRAQASAWRDAPLEAKLSSLDFDPAFLSKVTAMVRSIGGRIEADALISGTLGMPLLNGQVEWASGRLALAGYGNYRDVHLMVRGSNDEIVLEDFSAKSGSGKLAVSARADRRGDLFALSGKGELETFPLIVDDQLNSLLSGRFDLQGEASRELVFIKELHLPEVHVELPEVRRKDLQDLDRPQDIELTRNGQPLYKKKVKDPPTPLLDTARPPGRVARGPAVTTEPVDPDAEESALRFAMVVKAPKNIWVKGTDVNAELGLSDGFRIEIADRALMYGEVRFLRGRVDVLGRRFDIRKDSQVRFGGPMKVPFINLTAEHTNERQSITVFTTIRGQGKDVSVKVSSQPALTESEIYALLATGSPTLKRGSGSSMSSSEAATVATAYAASQLRRVIGSKIPLDVISFEAGSNGFADASGEAGTYITDDIYVGYHLRLGADPTRENMHSFRLEYQLSPRWSLETEYGDARQGGADFIWSKDY